MLFIRTTHHTTQALLRLNTNEASAQPCGTAETAASRSGALHLDALWRAAGRLLKLKIAEGKAAAHHALELGAAVPQLEVHWHLLLAPSCPVELRTLLVEARATGPRRYAEAHGRATDALRDRTGSGV